FFAVVGIVGGGGRGAHNLRGRDTFLKNGFAIGVVIIGDGEEQRRAVIQGDEFLFRGETKGAVAHQIAALGIGERGGKDFSSASSRAVHQNGNGRFPYNLAGIRGKDL